MKEWMSTDILAITMDILWDTYRTNLLGYGCTQVEYSKAVPAILHAYKRIGKWEYSDWFIEPELRLGLGRDLGFLVKLKFGEYSLDSNWLDWFDKDDIIQKACRGNPRLASLNYLPVPGLQSGYSKESWLKWSILPGALGPMLWAYHRHESMILDPLNWDAVPEPVHIAVQKPLTSEERIKMKQVENERTRILKEKGGMFSKGPKLGYVDI